MKKRIMRCITAILFFAVVLFYSIPAGHALESQRYGYRHLENDAQRVAYSALVDGIDALSNQIEFTANGITFDDVHTAIRVMMSDYPEFFWFNGSGTISSDSAGHVTFKPECYQVGDKIVTADNIASFKSELERAASAAMAGMPSGNSYDKALYLHDYIASQVVYVSDGHKNDQTAYGALVEGKAVCAGYARAYQYLLRKAGIESWYVTGKSEGQNHGWNLVLLDGKCYYTDVTWDDQTEHLQHTYFMLSLEQMNPTHTVDAKDALMLPTSCGHRDMGYFTVKGGAGTGLGIYTENVTANDVAGWCKKEAEGIYTCLIQDDTGLLGSWLNANWQQICEELGLTGALHLESSILGNEYKVTFTGSSAQEHVHDVTLTKVAAKKPTCTAGGNIEYYTCRSCGTLFADKAGSIEITDPDSVLLAATGHSYTNLESNSTEHWSVCDCGAEQSGSKAAHTDQNQDNKCDVCQKKLQSSSQSPTEETTSTEPPTAPTVAPVVTEPVETGAGESTEIATEEATENATEALPETGSSTNTQPEQDPPAASDAASSPSDSATITQTEASNNSTDEPEPEKPSLIPVIIVICICLAAGGAVAVITIRIRKKK